MLHSREFPWFLNPRTSWGNERGTEYVDEWPDSGQFVHNLILQGEVVSQYTMMILEMLRWDKVVEATGIPEKIIRMKANLLPRMAVAPEHNPPHLDLGEHHTAALLYINDSDGDTVFFNRTRGENPAYGDESLEVIQREPPKAGDLIVFDGDRFHASSPPKRHDWRAVFNFTLQTEEDQAAYR